MVKKDTKIQEAEDRLRAVLYPVAYLVSLHAYIQLHKSLTDVPTRSDQLAAEAAELAVDRIFRKSEVRNALREILKDA